MDSGVYIVSMTDLSRDWVRYKELHKALPLGTKPLKVVKNRQSSTMVGPYVIYRQLPWALTSRGGSVRWPVINGYIIT